MDSVEALLTSANPQVRELAAEVLRLRNAISLHHSASGHELCWLNDVELWKAAGLEGKYPHATLPVREEFLGQCAKYHESRLKGTPYAEPAAKKTVT
jgi:hypothetical protein